MAPQKGLMSSKKIFKKKEKKSLVHTKRLRQNSRMGSVATSDGQYICVLKNLTANIKENRKARCDLNEPLFFSVLFSRDRILYAIIQILSDVVAAYQFQNSNPEKLFPWL